MEKLDIKPVFDQLVVNIVVTDIDVALKLNDSLNSDGNILSRGPTLYGINIKEIGKIYVRGSPVKNSSVLFTDRVPISLYLLKSVKSGCLSQHVLRKRKIGC
jgi:hypothetical protein